jgi:hypothetical protein
MTNQVRVARSSSLIDSPPKYKTPCTKSGEEPRLDADTHLPRGAIACPTKPSDRFRRRTAYRTSSTIPTCASSAMAQSMTNPGRPNVTLGSARTLWPSAIAWW